MLWKTDMLRGDKGLKTFCSTLKMTAVKLEQTPRSLENVPLLSELAGFASVYEESDRSTAASIAVVSALSATVDAVGTESEYADDEFGDEQVSESVPDVTTDAADNVAVTEPAEVTATGKPSKVTAAGAEAAVIAAVKTKLVL
ncbi:hypothetical protein PR002_g29502 [Phytophthora rubi]|uniref:Uncharacterized protein n=1 Tax=Phytophthora rubi TaxID=129364 RepID=A0A6A3H0Q9_9STRA|nr:hypothetical protein PR002_g29502 [Phytophthora rubi]